jgi:NADPH2:quinone reductase
MKAVLCEKLGSYKDLVLRDIDEPPAPGPGEIKVAMKARGLAFGDLVRFEGNYQIKSPLPFVVGGEGAGIVVEVGPEVENIKAGDSVLCGGGCVELVNVKAKHVKLAPEGVDLNAAASFRSNYLTALYGLQLAQLQPGETLLVHGAGGGVGLAAVDLGKLMGARVIASASTEAKLMVAKKLGADHGINYTNGFREEVKALTGGRGADVIYDPVGGDVFDESVRSVAPFGRILVVGFAGGRAAEAKTNHLLVKDVSVIGYTVGGLQKHKPARVDEMYDVLLDWLAHGRIKPFVSHVLPMEEAVAAYQLIVDREVIGKVILESP